MKASVIRALATHDLLDWTTELVDLMGRLDSTNVADAVAAYEGAARGIDARGAGLFANAWGRFDYEAAIDRFLTFPNPAVQLRAVAEVIFYKARSGGAKEVREYAENAVLGNANLSAADRATAGGIILDAAARGLAAAGEYAELTKLLEILPSDRARSFLMTKALIEFGRSAGNAREWAESIPWDAQNQLKKLDVRERSGGLVLDRPGDRDPPKRQRRKLDLRDGARGERRGRDPVAGDGWSHAPLRSSL